MPAISQSSAGPGNRDARRRIPAGAVESRWRAADGHAIRRIDWPAPAGTPRGSILFLPGRADGYEKYLETLAHWHACGWRVTAADWRGQGGSGRLGADDVTGHIDDFAVWVGDLAALWRDWSAAAPGPLVLAGHSMGGHLALRAVAEGAVQADAMVLSAPMLGLTGRMPAALTHAAARLMRAIGDPRRPAWKWSDEPGQPPPSRAGLLTHDPDRYADEAFWREQRPELVMGPGSWGWVESAYASMRGLRATGVLERVTIPALILAARHDALVAFAAIEASAARMPRAELIAFGPEAHHEILRETDGVRDRALAAIDAFLDRVTA